MSSNNNLVAQGVQTWIGFDCFKYLFWELLIISVIGALAMHKYWHFDYFAAGGGTFLGLIVVLMFRKLAMIFTAIMSGVWGAFGGFIAYALYVGNHYPVSWAAVIIAGIIVAMISGGLHMYAIGFLRTSTQPLE